QAEDGIRDRTVTGVQTCALPIFRPRISCDQEPHGACAAALHESRTDEVKVERANGRECLAGSVKLAFLRVTWLVTAEAATIVSRSEERRVGKEGRRRRAGSA